MEQPMRVLVPVKRVIDFNVKIRIKAEKNGVELHIPVHAQPKLRLVGKAVAADDNEISLNPRARSAHLRIAERLEGKAA